MFHCWKANRGLKLSCNLWTRLNDHIHMYSLWATVGSIELVTFGKKKKKKKCGVLLLSLGIVKYIW